MLREHWQAGVRGDSVVYTYIYRVVREHLRDTVVFQQKHKVRQANFWVTDIPN